MLHNPTLIKSGVYIVNLLIKINKEKITKKPAKGKDKIAFPVASADSAVSLKNLSAESALTVALQTVASLDTRN